MWTINLVGCINLWLVFCFVVGRLACVGVLAFGVVSVYLFYYISLMWLGSRPIVFCCGYTYLKIKIILLLRFCFLCVIIIVVDGSLKIKNIKLYKYVMVC